MAGNRASKAAKRVKKLLEQDPEMDVLLDNPLVREPSHTGILHLVQRSWDQMPFGESVSWDDRYAWLAKRVKDDLRVQRSLARNPAARE
jgi:hypothetical protein